MRVPMLPIALAAIFCAGGAASASEAFRCGTHIVSDGDDKALVLEHCGEPMAKEDVRWIYDRGPTKMLVVVHFEGDKVSLIEEMPRD